MASSADGGASDEQRGPHERLARYRQIRDFAATPEPAGAAERVPDGRRFVIQQHNATRLHWDLRLEHDGVLVSFALPRGLPWTPEQDRLAVHTEDHPLEYLEFHGEIPAGEYGGGRMTIWDRGTYEPHTFRDDKVVVTLTGTRVRGTFSLFPVRDRDWMIHRMDPPQDPDRRPLPDDLRPMCAGARGMPEDDGWAFEILWTGRRALLTNDAGRVSIVDADGNDIERRFPEIRRIGRELAAIEVVLDTVLVAVDREGRPLPDASRIERRLAASSDSATRRLADDLPAAALAVDVLWLEGGPTVELPYDERRALLDELQLEGPAWQAPSNHLGPGAPLLAVAQQQGLAGLIAKRRTSRYRPGERSDDWREVR